MEERKGVDIFASVLSVHASFAAELTWISTLLPPAMLRSSGGSVQANPWQSRNAAQQSRRAILGCGWMV
jgi:hypothetical protein